jgi:hypothetical protein
MSEKFGMAVILCAVPANLELDCTKLCHATLAAATLQLQDFEAEKLLNVKRPIKLENMDQKSLDSLYRRAFHDLMKKSKSAFVHNDCLF